MNLTAKNGSMLRKLHKLRSLPHILKNTMLEHTLRVITFPVIFLLQ